jgi:hypothetical protein
MYCKYFTSPYRVPQRRIGRAGETMAGHWRASGGNFATDFESGGLRGYEATGRLGLLLGAALGAVLGAALARARRRDG